MNKMADNSQKNQRIEVSVCNESSCRCRPLNSIEKKQYTPSIVEVIPEKIVVKDENADQEFLFDKVFPPDTKHDEEAAIILGISIPVDPSKGLQTHPLEAKSQSLVFPAYAAETLSEFCNLPFFLDPNFGIMGKLPSSNILYENDTFNSWNIEHHFIQSLPLSTYSCETSILIIGGLNSSLALRRNPVDFDHDDFVLGSSIFQYLPNSRIWKYYGTMIEPRCYHACVLDVDKQFVYITGGYSLLKREHGEMLAVSSTDRLNLNNRQWKRCANMVTARATHAIASHKSFLYVFGGRCSQGKILSSVEIYNPDQDTWALLTSTPQPAMGLCATSTSNSIWIFGGITSDSSGKPSKHLLQNVYSFSPSLKRWNEEPSLPFACAFSSCVSNEHSLWLVGGCVFAKNPKSDTFVSCSSVLQLSLSEKHLQWKSVASLLYPRHALTAVLHEKCIYILGGMESTNKVASTVVEVINTTTNTNDVCCNILVPIAGCTSVIINGNFSIPRVCLNNLAKNAFMLLECKDEKFHQDHQCLKCDKNSIQETFNTTSDFSDKESSIQISEKPETFTILENISETEEKDISFLNTDESQLDSKKYSNETVNGTISTNNIEETNLDNEFQEEKNLLNTYFETNLDNEFQEEKNLLDTYVETNNGQTDDLHNVQYRASMEIFLNSSLENIAPSSSTLNKKSSSASKWFKFLNSLSVSDEKLHREVFESTDPKLSVKTEVDCTNSHNASEKSTEVKYFGKLSDLEKLSNLNSNSDLLGSTCDAKPLGQQSFMYVQSSLKSSLDVKSNEKNLEDENHIRNFDNISSTCKTEIKMDTLDGPFQNGKIDITEECFPMILVMGGEHPTDTVKSKYILLYNCNEDVWKYVGLLPEYRCHHCIIYVNKKIFIIGGYGALTSTLYDTISSKILCYNFYNETWYHTASMSYSRANHSTVLLGNDIFVLGGRDELGNILSSVESYSELNNEWRDCKPLPYPVFGAATTVLNGVLYVLGGITYKEEYEIISSSTFIYDPQTSSWSLGPELPIPLAFCGVSTFSNSMWIFGGLKEDDVNIISGKDIFKFDITTNIWSKVAKLSVPRHAPVTVSLDSTVYVIGGYSIQDKGEVVTCELIDMSKNEVSTKKELPIAASGRAGILITELNKNNT